MRRWASRIRYESLVTVLAGLACCGTGSTQGQAHHVPATPAATKHPPISSSDSKLLGILYLASGAGPHPTAILFHGFPGFEQNLDLAQALRRSGWNVLAYHYRGSWGVDGEFSFLHCVEDGDAEVRFVFDEKNDALYHIDPNRIVVIGHSMGGLIATSAAAHNPRVKAVILISAWNVGAKRSSEIDEARALGSGENLLPIAQTDGAKLAHEEFTHRAELDMTTFAKSIPPRPVMIVTASDGSDQFAEPLIEVLRKAGGSRTTRISFNTDHAYSDKRLELIASIVSFIQGV